MKMSAIIPILLVGDNLGKRHQYLNSLVHETYISGEDFDTIKNLPEISPVDRLFKIDLASKIRNVDYIFQNLKDDDMLYISRALKAKWLIDKKHENIINPQYLETRIYPEMINTAVNKMQHWIHHNLNDELRCEQFYHFYYKKNIDLAIKFLTNCSKDVIQIEFPKILLKVTPHVLKILCEKCSQVAKIFFDSLSHNKELVSKYLKQEWEYFCSVKSSLKTNGDIVLDIAEKYFNHFKFQKFNSKATKFIMTYHKSRFWQKPELYVSMLLDLPALANSISGEEAEHLIVNLSRAKYLNYLPSYIFKFSYDSVEPLVKRLRPECRTEFKKKVFVRKEVGKEIENWPYELPSQPKNIQLYQRSCSFDDRQSKPCEYKSPEHQICYMPAKLAKKCGKNSKRKQIKISTKIKTAFDIMFDEYRFSSFGQTLYELRKRIAAESSRNKRQLMLLVLVSKTGSRPEAIASLLELLLAQHSNETPNFRAAIIRSLVKRAHVWRLPEIYWNQFLEYGQGLGLDGGDTVAECLEGLHAVVIRHLLLNGECPPDVKNAFLSPASIFCNLTHYLLSATEKSHIGYFLPKMMLTVIKETKSVAEAVQWIYNVIDTLRVYQIKMESFPEIIAIIVEYAEKKFAYTKNLIRQLFDAKIARKHLFPYSFILIKSDASYVNVLKHDPTLLYKDEFSLSHPRLRADSYFTKLSIYFSEENGLASTVLNKLKIKATSKYISILSSFYSRRIKPLKKVRRPNKPYNMLGRPIAILLRGKLKPYLQELYEIRDEKSKLLAASIKANAHITRPSIYIGVSGWKKDTTKFIANIVLKCRAVEIDNNIEELLKRKRTAKLAFTLSNRTNYETEIFLKLAKVRPKSAIEPGLKLLKLQDDQQDPRVWETMKPIIQELDLTKDIGIRLVKNLARVENIPLKIRPEYSTVLYTLYKKISFDKAMPLLCHVEILLPDANDQFIENLLHEFLKYDLGNKLDASGEHNGTEAGMEAQCGKSSKTNEAKQIALKTRGVVARACTIRNSPHHHAKCACLHIRILVKYLFFCKSEYIQKARLETFGDPFLAKLEEIRKYSDHKPLYLQFINEILLTFTYNKVFFDIQYVSALPVMEKTGMWMKTNLSFERHFGTFIQLHLSIFYCKAVRESLELVPDLFRDENTKHTEGATEVANRFGKYIARDVNSLTAKHFDSIIELYSKNLVKYLKMYSFGTSSLFLMSMIRGFLQETKGSEYRMIIDLSQDMFCLRNHSKEIHQFIKEVNGIEVIFFTCAHTFINQYNDKRYSPPTINKTIPRRIHIPFRTAKGEMRKIKANVN